MLTGMPLLGFALVAQVATSRAVAAASDTLVATATGARPTLLMVGLGVLMLIIGLGAGIMLAEMIAAQAHRKGQARWPRDWPKPVFASSETDPGYFSLKPEAAMKQRAMPFGRTYPRMQLFPNIWPFSHLRFWVMMATSKPVQIPYKKRFQHTAILGGTGKGKSTSFVIPPLTYGAMEPDTAYFAIDVKSPQFLRTFAPLYQKAGKPVYFIDPWTPGETMAFEPVWRADHERKKVLAEVISNYSLEPSSPQESGNSEFFKNAANRLMRILLDMAQFWPRRYAKLPCIAQLVGGGGDAIKEAIQQLPTLLPTQGEVVEAALRLAVAPTEALAWRGRTGAVSADLEVLDRSGAKIASRLREARQALWGPKGAQPVAEAQRGPLLETLRRDVTDLWRQRDLEMKKVLKASGEFISMPDDTRNSVVSTIQNKVEWFADPQLAIVFSRDEVDPDFITQRPCLFLVGAPMAKLQIGSLFVSSIITNLVDGAIFQRGQYLENRELGGKISKHGIFMMLDEFPQLNVKNAHKSLATLRSFLAGYVMIYQDRGQLKQIYGDNVTTVESNTIHRVVLQGIHEEAAEFYASKTMGKATIRKKNYSGTEGESKRSYNIQDERVDLMSPNDLIYMKLNGQSRPDMAINMTKDFDPFPMRPLPFYEDPVVRKLLGMERTLKKVDQAGRKTWKFWLWQEAWDFPSKSPKPLLVRRRPLSEAERAAGQEDLCWERQQDLYTEYLDYVAPERRTGWDELSLPDLDFATIGVLEHNPDPAVRAALQGGAAPGAGKPAPGGFGASAPAPAAQAPTAPPAPAVPLVPLYSRDIRALMSDDFAPLGAVWAPSAGALAPDQPLTERVHEMAPLDEEAAWRLRHEQDEMEREEDDDAFDDDDPTEDDDV